MENRDLEIGSSDVDDEPMEYGKEHETDDEVDHSGTGSRSDLPASDGELTTRAKFIPVTLAFKNLFYSVKVRKGKNPFQKKHKKTLLKDLHGELRPGEVTAIMGPSGAGKTTLLNLLAGRVQGGKTKGSLTVNDIPKDHISSRRWQRLSSYVMQDDVMYPMLTPRETFWFSAQLKLPFTEHNKKAKVDALIEELGLEKCQKTKIGDAEHRGISGGQRKRVSIGMEMITDPSILFLDEPTSGLDSSTAYSLVEKLQHLAAMGRTIVTTIHQPSTDIFFKFDRLMLLAEGHMVYNGPTKDVVAYFGQLGYKCPKYTNPAEFIMNLVKADSYISSKEGGEERLKHLISAFRDNHNLPALTEDGGDYADGIRRSGSDDKTVTRRSKLKKKRHHNHGDEDVSKIPVTSGPNFLYRWGLLFVRSGIMQSRDPMQIPARLSQALFLSLLVGFLYLQIGDDQQSIGDRQGSLFFVVMSMAMGPMMGCLVVFQAERVVFIREHSTGSYSTLTYYLAKVLADIPFLTLVPIVQGTISYWMVGYQAEADKYFIFIAACIAVTLVAHALGLSIGAGAPNLNVSMAMAPMIFIPLMLLGGFFLSDDSIPKWLMWIKYFSPFKYGFQILARNEFDGLTFTCSTDPAASCTPTGDKVLSDLSLDNDEGSLWASFLFLFMQYFFFHSLAYFLLRITAGRRKA